MDQSIGDILVLPFFGQGHINPCVELCKNLSALNHKSILILPSHLSSSIPSTLDQNPLIDVLIIPKSTQPPSPEGAKPRSAYWPPAVQPHHKDLRYGIQSFLEKNYAGQIRPGCVVMDMMMSWSNEIFMNEKIPIVAFCTSGACSTAIEYAAWKTGVQDLQPGETRILSGLPECLAMSFADFTRRELRPGGGGGGRGGPGPVEPGGQTAAGGGRGGGRGGSGPVKSGGQTGGFGPPRPGQPPRWLDDAQCWTAMFINTCEELEGPFIKYLAKEIGKPVFGVGPLLPEKYWKSNGSVIHDKDSRPNRESNYKESEIIEWLDTKPSQSVIYIAFGSEVGPTMEEYAQLAEALAELNRSFIWVIQPGSGKSSPPSQLFGGKPKQDDGYYPHGLEEKVGDRGLTIRGWAPQLSILSHPSTGGFLSHCGWNSTLEAIGRGVPFLTWPIRGDQFYNSNWIVKYLKAGHTVYSGEDLSKMVKKSDIMRGIEILMDDTDVQSRANKMVTLFNSGYPPSSTDSLKALIGLSGTEV